MTQHNLTEILKVIRDLVMRNRPCYRDYLGSETVTKTTAIGSGVFEDRRGMAGAVLSLTDASFTGFILGETYTVTIDGATADYVARNISPISEQVGPIIGTTTTFDMENNTFDGWMAMADLQGGAVACMAQTLDTSFIGKTISISQTKTETVTRYNTKLLPEYLLPTFLRKNVVASKTEVQKAQTTADDAQTTADNAQSTADSAQSTASAAQSTANTAKSTAEAAQSTANTAKTTADAAQTTAETAQTTANSAKNLANAALTPSRPDSSTNACAYHANNPYDNDARVYFYIGGTSFLRILVDKTSSVVKINPPVNMNAQADFEFSRLTSAYPHPKIKGIGGIVMHSSTSGSNKQFLITVDDSGTLTATEVTS